MKYRIDYETRSRADLKKVGAAAYAYHPSTEILCLAVSAGTQRPLVWVPKEFRSFLPMYAGESVEAEKLLRQAVSDVGLIGAFNAAFECFISDALWLKTFGFQGPRHSQWRCTQAKARRAALPASLGKCAEALGLAQKKDTRGAALIRKFSIPDKKTDGFNDPSDHVQDFIDFCEYCRQDVVVEEAIDAKLKDFDLTGIHLKVSQLTLDINTRGIPVNLDALHKAQKIVDVDTERMTAEFNQLTGLQPTQTKAFLEWAVAHGYDGKDLRSETMDELLQDEEFDTSTLLGRALSLKKMTSYAAVKKVPAMIACAGPHDNRVRGTLIDYGAGTGRWSAVLIQPQNMKKPSQHLETVTEDIYRDIIDGASAADLALCYGPPLECISSCIRHFIHDAAGELLDADYSAIEARIIAWQAQEEWRLEVFRTHGAIYEASAHQMFGTPMEDFATYKRENGTSHPHRKKGKVAELALGYQGGVNAMVKMGAEKEGLERKEMASIVKAWRAASPAVVQLWYDAENAARSAVSNKGQRYPFGVGCEFFCATTAGIDYLFLRLPSGRRIAYPWPKLEKQLTWVTVSKETEEEIRHTLLNPTVEEVARARKKDPKARVSLAITYWGQIPLKVTWGRSGLYGGRIVENICQGIAADVMAIGAYNAWQAGYEIVSLIHDEALAHYRPGQSIEEFIELLTDMPEWADGLPLKADGGVIPFYRKD